MTPTTTRLGTEVQPMDIQPCIPDSKIAHMTGVAKYMLARASAYGIDKDVAYTTGLLHDIGYLHGHDDHEENGYNILCECGMDPDSETAIAVAFHAKLLSRLPVACVSPLLVLTVEADLSVDAKGNIVGSRKRLADIEARYGRETIGKVKNMPIYDSVRQNMDFIISYRLRNHICSPLDTFRGTELEGVLSE